MTSNTALSSERFVAALGRPERTFDLAGSLAALKNERILITGADGMIGTALSEILEPHAQRTIRTDLRINDGILLPMDITNRDNIKLIVNLLRPTLIVNTAAQKLAVLGEEDPWQTINVSVNGVKNLLDTGLRVVHCSTCKAADPEVAYGIGKAAAEKLVLDAGGTVVRFYNIVEAGPSVYDIWGALGESEPLPVTPCTRHIISLNEAIGSLVSAMTLPAGRYAVDPGNPVSMDQYAYRLFPDRAQVEIPPRRGDRLHEPFHARCEHVEETEIPYLNKIVSQHDQ